MADSSLCTKTFNESNYEKNKTTKTAENLENTKTRSIMDYEMEENIKPQKHEENMKQQIHEKLKKTIYGNSLEDETKSWSLHTLSPELMTKVWS